MWMKVDDQLHAHPKTRALTKSHHDKRRDAAPMGLWVLAGSWAAQNGTDGWVPEDELDRWDDAWHTLVGRLVRTGWWWPQDRKGESGYGFNDWHDYNDPADLASKAGSYGNHVRWHVNEAKVDPACEHCPKEPNRGDIGPESGGDRGAIDTTAPESASPQVNRGVSGGESGGDSRIPSPPIALPEPEPEPEPDPNPTRTREQASSDESDQTETPDRFDEFWNTYGKKVDRKGSKKLWAAALKKPGITAELLIASAAAYVLYERDNQGGRFVMDPSKWLRNERWADERPARAAPQTNMHGHYALVHQLGENAPSPFPEIGSSS